LIAILLLEVYTHYYIELPSLSVVPKNEVDGIFMRSIHMFMAIVLFQRKIVSGLQCGQLKSHWPTSPPNIGFVDISNIQASTKYTSFCSKN